MSLSAVGRVFATASYPVPARTAPESRGSVTAGATALVRIIRPVQGSAPFLAQHLAQEVIEDGAYVPRWRERAAAYAQPSARATYDYDLTA
jgi:hypothetical protein